MAYAGLAVAAFVAMNEIDRIVRGVSAGGSAWSLSQVYGLGTALHVGHPLVEPWQTWALATAQFPIRSWITIHLGFDLLFILGYTGLLLLTAGRWSAVSKGLIVAVAGLDVTEDLAAGLTVSLLGPAGPVSWTVVILQVTTTLKWLAVLVLLVCLGYQARAGGVAPVWRVLGAVKFQRYSAVVIVLLGLLMVGPGGGIFDQLPDVERAWFTSGARGLGLLHLGVAGLSLLLLAFLLLYVGRLRTRRSVEIFTTAPDHAQPHRYRWWVGAPLVLVAVAWLAQRGHVVKVDWSRVSVFALVLAVTAGVSAVAGVVHRRFGPAVPAGAAGYDADGIRLVPVVAPAPDNAMVDLVRACGDVFAVAALAIAGVGLVRSFVTPALLLHDGDSIGSWLLVLVGLAASSVLFVLCGGPVQAVLRALMDSARVPDSRVLQWARDGQPPVGRWVLIMLLVTWPFLVAVSWLLAYPLTASHLLGVLGTVVVSLGSLTTGLAVLAFQVHRRYPLPIFRLLRIWATPVISIIAVVVVLGSMVDRGSPLHRIRLPAGAAGVVGAQPGTLLASLQTWLDRTGSTTCRLKTVTVPASDGSPVTTARVAPLLLVAASGGGIRAAWWTVHALSDIAGSACGRDTVFAASGVSGGSVGLAVLASSTQPVAALTRIAGPDALASALDGLLLRDMLASSTGIMLGAFDVPAGQRFPDRAGLMELSWERADPGLRKPFPLAAPAVPWRLIFNTTAVESGCKAVLADRALSTKPAGDLPASASPPGCELGSAGAIPRGYDVLAALPCLRGLDTSTAAMLSARFPYVTPSGVAGCNGRPVEQYVDGGYGDSSGLATLDDLAPGVLDRVRAHNAAALADAASTGRPPTVVVPMVVYLENDVRADSGLRAVTHTSEGLVPTHAGSTATAQNDADALLERAQGQLAPWLACAATDPGCALLRSAVGRLIPDQVILVAPRTAPRLSAPLGWVLSGGTRSALDDALAEEQASTCWHRSSPAPHCIAGVGRLGDLLGVLPTG